MKKFSLSLIIFLVFVSLSCSLPISKIKDKVEPKAPTKEMAQATTQKVENPTQTVYSPPTARPTSVETATPKPSTTPEIPTEVPTETPQACPQFGKEEFDSPNDCWPHSLDTVLSTTGISNPNKVYVGIRDGRLVFESQLPEDIFLYSIYQNNEYDNVILRAAITKIEPSVNQNGFTFVCHYNKNGWYEARIESSGSFEIYQYDAAKKQKGGNPFISLGSGGAAAYRIGADFENIVEWQCDLNSLTLIVNGKQTWQKKNIATIIGGGAVGVGLASYSGRYPRQIGFEYVEIEKP